MAKKGRPFTYQSEEDKPVTVSLRIPRDLHTKVERYTKPRGMSFTEFVLEGIQLRLETPADPRDIILSDDNTVIQDLQAMIRDAVQKEIGKLQTFLEPHGTLGAARPPAAAPAPEVVALAQDDNTVIQENEPDIPQNYNTVIYKSEAQVPAQRGTMRQRILDLLQAHPGLTTEQIRAQLSPERPLGDTLQGMRRQQVVRVEGSGKAMRYFVP